MHILARLQADRFVALPITPEFVEKYLKFTLAVDESMLPLDLHIGETRVGGRPAVAPRTLDGFVDALEPGPGNAYFVYVPEGTLTETSAELSPVYLTSDGEFTTIEVRGSEPCAIPLPEPEEFGRVLALAQKGMLPVTGEDRDALTALAAKFGGTCQNPLLYHPQTLWVPLSVFLQIRMAQASGCDASVPSEFSSLGTLAGEVRLYVALVGSEPSLLALCRQYLTAHDARCENAQRDSADGAASDASAPA